MDAGVIMEIINAEIEDSGAGERGEGKMSRS